MKVLLNPIIISLLFIVLILAAVIFIYWLSKRKNESNLLILEKSFTFGFFVLLLIGNERPYVGNLTLEYLGSHYVNSNIAQYVVLQLVIYSLVAFLLRSRIHYFFKAIIFLLKDPFLASLIVLTVLSAFWSETLFDTFKGSLVFLGLIIYASIIAVRCSFQELTKYSREFGTFIAISTIFVHFLLPALENNPKGTWQGITGHPNTLSYLMALSVVLWCLNAVDRPKERWRSIGQAILATIVMIFAGSSGSIALLIVLVSLSIFFRILRSGRFHQAFLSSIVLLTVSIPATIVLIGNKSAIFKLFGRDENLTGRGDFWPEVIASIKQRLLFGYGYHGFWQSWRGMDNPAAQIRTYSDFIPTHSHNGFLELGLQLGLVGIVLFILSLFRSTICIFWLMYSGRADIAEIALLILAYHICANLSEVGLWELGYQTVLYILVSVRLGVEISIESFARKNPEELSYYQSH